MRVRRKSSRMGNNNIVISDCRQHASSLTAHLDVDAAVPNARDEGLEIVGNEPCVLVHGVLDVRERPFGLVDAVRVLPPLEVILEPQGNRPHKRLDGIQAVASRPWRHIRHAGLVQAEPLSLCLEVKHLCKRALERAAFWRRHGGIVHSERPLERLRRLDKRLRQNGLELVPSIVAHPDENAHKVHTARQRALHLSDGRRERAEERHGGDCRRLMVPGIEHRIAAISSSQIK